MKAQPAAAPISPIGTLTRKINRQPPAASSKPPTVGPEGQAQGLRRALDAERPPQPAGRRHQGDDGDAVGLEHGRADGLQRPETEEGAQVGAGPQRAEPTMNTTNPYM